MLSQIPTLIPGDLERWLIPAAAVLSLVALVKKIFPRKRSDDEFATRLELQHELTAVRDKIDARFFLLGEKIDNLNATLANRLAALEASVARLDERTKTE